MNSPKILVLDIETRPMEAFIWGRRDVNIGLAQIKKDWYIMAWSAKWLDKPHSLVYKDQRNAKDTETDESILGPLWKLLDEADIVITQNGQKFDTRRINARFMAHGMASPSPYKQLDTYRIAKRVGDFTSCSLEYLCKELKTKHQKLKHAKFAGWSLWIECLKGNKEAWEAMKKYNINDTLCTEDLYNKLKPWIPESMTKVYYAVGVCRLCGPNTKMWHKGYETKKSGKYHRFQCQDCFAWTTGGKV